MLNLNHLAFQLVSSLNHLIVFLHLCLQLLEAVGRQAVTGHCSGKTSQQSKQTGDNSDNNGIVYLYPPPVLLFNPFHRRSGNDGNAAAQSVNYKRRRAKIHRHSGHSSIRVSEFNRHKGMVLI